MQGFGYCGCCGSGLTGNTSLYQRAWSFAPYFMGWIGQAADGSPIENPLYHTILSTTKIPLLIYLKLTETRTGDSGTLVSVTTWQKDGTATTVSTGPSDTGSNSHTSYVLDNPYSFADLAAFAISGLDSIILLNPGKSYDILDSQGRPTACNFGYSGDPGFGTAPIKTSTLAITMAPSSVSGFALAAGQYFTTISDTSGDPGAQNGVWNSGPAAISGGGDSYGPPGVSGNPGGWFAFKKTACRIPGNILRRADITLSGYPQYTAPWRYTVLNLPPGEHIFLPSDGPGYGLSVWSTSAAPGL